MFRPMRRLVPGLVVLAVVAAAPVTMASTALAQSSGGKAEVLATLKVTTEKVEVKKQGTDKFKAAKDGDKLRQGDTVRTNGTGLAEIDYTDDGGSYTRLDVNTTFTITKLTEDQGSRQVQGSLETGQAWNRTEAITESGSFEQEGAGANATVLGTAFNMECDAVDHCVFTAIVHDISLTGIDGTTKVLDPLQQCESDDTQGGTQAGLTGELCDQVTQLTVEQLIAMQWIQDNLLKDLLEHGYGPGPFTLSGTIVVESGQVASFTPTPPPPPAPPAAPVIGDPPLFTEEIANPGDLSLEPAGDITAHCDYDLYYVPCSFVLFRVNVTSPSDLSSNVWVVFTELPSTDLGSVKVDCVEDGGGISCSGGLAETDVRYPALTVFAFDANDATCPSSVTPSCVSVDTTTEDYTESGSMTFHAETNEASSPDKQVDVNVITSCSECGESAEVSGEGEKAGEKPKDRNRHTDKHE